VTGPVEQAVRRAISPGDRLATPSGRGHFTVARYTADGLVLLLGEKEAWTPLPWRALEEVPDFLRGRGWVLNGQSQHARSAADPGASRCQTYLAGLGHLLRRERPARALLLRYLQMRTKPDLG